MPSLDLLKDLVPGRPRSWLLVLAVLGGGYVAGEGESWLLRSRVDETARAAARDEASRAVSQALGPQVQEAIRASARDAAIGAVQAAMGIVATEVASARSLDDARHRDLELRLTTCCPYRAR